MLFSFCMTNLKFAGHSQTQQFHHLKPVDNNKPKAVVKKKKERKKQIQSNI